MEEFVFVTFGCYVVIRSFSCTVVTYGVKPSVLFTGQNEVSGCSRLETPPETF